MILKNIEINCFRSIRNTCQIVFDERVTILLGANDHGKSNILAAISHLNQDKPFIDDDLNWGSPKSDSKRFPAIKAIFELNLQESSELYRIVSSLNPETDAINNEIVTNEGQTTWQYSNFLSPELIVERVGIPGNLSYNGDLLSDLHQTIQAWLIKYIPRFELFSQFSGDLQDQADASSITSPNSEFIQGIFFQAGLEQQDWTEIFAQNDSTIKQLDDASEVLNANLSGMWGQGANLKFMLRHQASTIQFFVQDPTVDRRYVRLSKKSTGVTHFFRLSMILHARRKKHPANSYVYLFDEPGVFLHPLGQRDLLQAFELLTDTFQIILSTHSLFLLNTNFPERHRLVFMDATGTAIDHKPYRASWRLATDALGIRLGSMALFSNSTLLVEGESDPIYLYEILRALNLAGVSEADANQLGVMSYTNLPTLKYLIQMLTSDNQKTQLAVLLDGDKGGKQIGINVQKLCEARNVPIIYLPDGFSIENLCLFRDTFLESVVETIQLACQAENTPIPPDLAQQVNDAFVSQYSSRTVDNNDQQITLGYWFKKLSSNIVGSEASKTALARSYVDKCRERIVYPIRDEQIQSVDPIIRSQAQVLVENLVAALRLPNLKANKVVMGNQSS